MDGQLKPATWECSFFRTTTYTLGSGLGPRLSGWGLHRTHRLGCFPHHGTLFGTWYRSTPLPPPHTRCRVPLLRPWSNLRPWHNPAPSPPRPTSCGTSGRWPSPRACGEVPSSSWPSAGRTPLASSWSWCSGRGTVRGGGLAGSHVYCYFNTGV